MKKQILFIVVGLSFMLIFSDVKGASRDEYVAKQKALIASKPAFEASDKLVTYESVAQAISFDYPSNLYLYEDRSNVERWGETFPTLLFQPPPEEEHFERRICPVDCIRIGGIRTDIASARLRNAEQLTINGMQASRLYEVDRVQAGRTGHYLGDSLEESIYIQDPYIEDHLILLKYYELRKNLSANPALLKGQAMKALFDPEKYSVFQSIIASFKVLPVDTERLVTSFSSEYGISFQHPAFWGPLIEDIQRGKIGFNNLLVAPMGLATIRLRVHSPDTAGVFTGPYPILFQYAGQPLAGACEKDAYLDTLFFEIRINDCSLKILKSGLHVVIVKGSFALIYDDYKYEGELEYEDELISKGEFDLEGKDLVDFLEARKAYEKIPSEELRYRYRKIPPEGLRYRYRKIPPDERKFIPFKAALLRTKSSQRPGMTILNYMRSSSKMLNATQVEDTFDRMVNSLSYK